MYLILVNPEAGRQTFKRIETKFKRLLESTGVKYLLVIIDDLADIPELIEKNYRSSFAGVVAVGGNATVNAVINALANEDIPLGIVPISKSNYLAQTLGVKNWTEAVKMLTNPAMLKSRIGKIGRHYFIGQIHITSRHNLLLDYINTTSPLKKFLGLVKPATEKVSGVATQIALDESLVASGHMDRLTITLNGTSGPKKLKVETYTVETANKLHSLFHGDSIVITSDVKMPVIMGNETVAHTPVEIKGVSRYLNLLVPNKQLTKEINA